MLTPLAGAVIVSEAMFGRFGGYAAWDGREPDLAEVGEWADGGFGEHWHDVLMSHVSYRNFVGRAELTGHGLRRSLSGFDPIATGLCPVVVSALHH